MYTDKIKTAEQLKPILDDLKKQGKVVAFTNGCFDILHTGHTRYLQIARDQGDLLVVGVNTDFSVKLNKGDKRPIVPEDDRAELLAALEMVDFVVKFNEKTPENLVAELKPDVHVKGGDYTFDQMPEAKVVQAYGGKVITVPLVEGRATTNVIGVIVERFCS